MGLNVNLNLAKVAPVEAVVPGDSAEAAGVESELEAPGEAAEAKEVAERGAAAG